MTTFRSLGFIMVVLLSLGQPVFAGEEVPKENPLPQRDAPIPKIEGYADWKFTDSIRLGALLDFKFYVIEIPGRLSVELSNDPKFQEMPDLSASPRCRKYD